MGTHVQGSHVARGERPLHPPGGGGGCQPSQGAKGAQRGLGPQRPECTAPTPPVRTSGCPSVPPGLSLSRRGLCSGAAIPVGDSCREPRVCPPSRCGRGGDLLCHQGRPLALTRRLSLPPKPFPQLFCTVSHLIRAQSSLKETFSCLEFLRSEHLTPNIGPPSDPDTGSLGLGCLVLGDSNPDGGRLGNSSSPGRPLLALPLGIQAMATFSEGTAAIGTPGSFSGRASDREHTPSSHEPRPGGGRRRHPQGLGCSGTRRRRRRPNTP